MDIFINEQPLNFTLQGETDFSEVRREVMKWLAGEYYTVEHCEIDQRQIAPERLEEWDDTKIGDIDVVRFKVRPVAELNFEGLQTVYQYMLLLKKALEMENTGVFKELSGDYPIIEKELNRILNPGGGDAQNSDIILLTHQLEQTGFFQNTVDRKDAAVNAAKICGGFLSILHERMHEITNPKDELLASINALADLIGPMNNIPVLLQTGKDREAMQTVLQFVETSQKMLRLYPILKVTSDFDTRRKLSSGETLEQFYGDLNAILQELTEAFNAKDSVLIGDLLEYEIAPRIENLITLLH
jgi:hypothetical protein